MKENKDACYKKSDAIASVQTFLQQRLSVLQASSARLFDANNQIRAKNPCFVCCNIKLKFGLFNYNMKVNFKIGVGLL